MVEAEFLPRHESLPSSQDYAVLRARGLALIEQLAHEIWTDYNVHDPGITLLEALCFGITDVGLRTGYPVRDLLTEFVLGRGRVRDARRDPASGDEVSTERGRFHTAREIFTCNPVTFGDWRKLLIDVPGVRNAWIEKRKDIIYWLDRSAGRLTAARNRHTTEIGPLNGLYNVYIEYEDHVLPDGSARQVKAGMPQPLPDGDYIHPEKKGIEFETLADSRLDAVSVYCETAGTVTVRLLDSNGKLLQSSQVRVETDQAQKAIRVPLGFSLAARQRYRIDAYGSNVQLYRNSGVGYPIETAGVVRLLRGYPSNGYYFFFYAWEVACDPEAPTRTHVLRAVVDRLQRHRNLCEDVVEVCDLQPEDIAVCAEIELVPGADTEAIAAELFYRLYRHISPALRFYSIDELVRRGYATDEIFAGPPLDHGFIDPKEFEALRRRCEIRASDVLRAMLEPPLDGVIAVRKLELLSFIGDVLRAQESWLLTLSSDRFRAPRFSPEKSKIVFYKNDLPYFVNRQRVDALFAEKKATDLDAKLKGHATDVPVPTGEFRNPTDYLPIQHDLPLAYCVGRIEVPATETPLRRAQSKQLRAYLMFFEQLLANQAAQLAHLKDLYSWGDGAEATYFTQPVGGLPQLADVHAPAAFDPALGHARPDKLAALVEDEATRRERRLRFLEHLAARYAETFGTYRALMFALRADGAWAELIDDLKAFLKNYPVLSARRGTGYDYRRPAEPDNLSGYQRRIYGLLGIAPPTRRRLAGHRLVVGKNGTDPDARWHFVLLDVNEEEPWFKSIECESEQAIDALLNFTLEIAHDPSHWRTASDGSHELVRQCRNEAQNEVIGATVGSAVLDEVIAYFAEYGNAEGMHVVEHILMRRRTEADPFLPVQLDDGGGCPEVTDPYSFRATVLLPSWSSRFRDMQFRRFVEDTLRAEAPAHVYLRICWIGHAPMREFERRYERWCAALAVLEPRLAGCRARGDRPLDGALPLPPAPGSGEATAEREYADALDELIKLIFTLDTVYPLARLNDCKETTGDTPQVSLNNTRLGTF